MRRSGNEQKNGRAGSSADADDLCSHPHPCGVEKGAGGDENRTGRNGRPKAKKTRRRTRRAGSRRCWTVSTLPVRRRELLLWSWTRRSAKQHSSAQTSASNPMTTPVQTEKNPRRAGWCRRQLLLVGRKYQRKTEDRTVHHAVLDGVKGSQGEYLKRKIHQGRLWQSEGWERKLLLGTDVCQDQIVDFVTWIGQEECRKR